jgi:[glutamine synthetase] adenylyltransferase / [glutamine synthetase]-adenylyl-L-tyrosine phosphorylase
MRRRAPSQLAPDAAGGLASLIATAPQLGDESAARVRLADWLNEIGGTPEAVTLKRLLAAHSLLDTLIVSIAESAPYLWDLCRADATRLVAILTSDPAQHFTGLLQRTREGAAAAVDEAEAMRVLRRMKSEAALMIALTDIGGVWPVMRVTRALTEFANAAVGAAVRFVLADAGQRGRLRLPAPTRPDEGSGYVVLAMGKMGAYELNYSSDIDLIVFYEPATPALDDPDAAPGPIFVRITRALVKMLQERTPDGYVFRVDLRLRPDPSSTQIAISMPAALDYYESRGQNWERAALIKARACAGDPATGETILRNLSPFVWRRHLDYAAVADVHAMKRQIHAFRGHGEIAVEGHNIKLGRGGIREIEFFVQTQQLITGGRHPELRGRDTLATLAALAEGGWIGNEARDELDEAYRFLRRVEHRLQMMADEQIHTLPPNREGLERFSRFLGFEGRDAFAGALVGHLTKVQHHYAALFEDTPARGPDRAELNFPKEADDAPTLERLALMGYRRPAEVSAAVRRWHAGEYRALRGDMARQALGELVPLLIERFAEVENPDGAFVALDRFLAALQGARLLPLLRQNPDLIGLIALIIGTAPRLAGILASHPHVMDALIEPSFFGALPDEDKLASGLALSLAEAQSYEDFLDRVRIFGQEHMFLIGVRILSGTATAEQAGAVFARLADILVRALHRAVEGEFAKTHGRLAGQQTALIAMGKLGGREMTAASDLDLILIYDFDAEHPESDGARPLYGAQYFARLTQRLISALTAQTNYGKLYDVDMRLRPSGRSGPVATKIDSFASYQQTEAWTWEHMALTRARIVSASPGFAQRIERVIVEVLRRPRDPTFLAGDVAEMRFAIAAEKGEDERWNLKYAAGGLIDVEFVAQYLQLAHGAEQPQILDTSTARVLDKAWRLGVLSTQDAEVLRPAVRLYHDLTQILRLCLSAEFDAKTAAPGLVGLLTRAADVPDYATLEAYLTETQAKVRRTFEKIVGRPR